MQITPCLNERGPIGGTQRLDRKPGYLAAAACVPMRLVPHLANAGHGLKFADWDAKIGIEGQQNLN